MRRVTLPIFLFAASILLRPTSSAAATKPNVILITLDSTRADRMGFLGSKAKLTPNLDGVAAQSLVFERAYSQAPLTVVSHATILSGTYPQSHRVNELGSRLASSLPFLPALLNSSLYRTAAFVGSIALDPRNGFAPGFDRGFTLYDAGFQRTERGQGGSSSAQRPGAQVAQRAISWLTRNPAAYASTSEDARAHLPFFLWVNFSDPESAADASYNSAISAEDAALGKLISALRANKLYDDALIMVAADHGQSLNAHAEDSHGVFLYDETVHVPLLVKLPHNESAGKRVRVRVSLVDVAPTVMELAGLPVPSQMQGQSLVRIAKLDPNADRPAYSVSEFPQRAFGWSTLESWRAGKYLYVKAPRPELYDLSADPGAAHNLAQSSKGTLETIAAQLDAFDRRFTTGGKVAEGVELTSSEMQKLASLGYVGLQKSASPASAASSGADPKDGISVANKVLLAQHLLSDGKVEKAVATLRPILTVASKMYLAQYVMGVALARQGEYSQAIERLRVAIELWPDSTWAHYEMGSSLLGSGDYKTAVIHLEIAASRLPESSEAHSRLAQAYGHLGRPDDAKHEQALAAAAKK